MIINSSTFGELKVSQDKIITFSPAIPGFDSGERYFIFTDDENETNEGEHLFCWLHSADDEDLAFALLDVLKIKDDYQPEIEEEYLKMLLYEEGDIINVYNIVNIPENVKDMTVNLLAPLVINFTKMRGMQVILESGKYKLKHKIFEELNKAGKEVV